MSHAELKPNLETILNEVNRFINIDSDRAVYASHFSKLRDQIFKELRQNGPFGYLFNGYQLGGSYGDNLKVSIPNEFDLVFHITFPDNKLIDVIEDDERPGNVHIDLTKVLYKIRNEKQHANLVKEMKKWVNDDNYLIIKKLQGYIEGRFIKALENMNYGFQYLDDYAHLRYTKEGPAHTLHVKGNRVKYSVDFVPGLLLTEEQSVMPHASHVGQWEAIPKPIKNATPNNTSFRSSFYRQEHLVMQNNKNLKNVLRMMKKFRDAHQNMYKMKSYFIKTLFLWKAKEMKGQPRYWQQSLQIIVIDMFKAMENSLQTKNLPFFWDLRLNLYDEFNGNLCREMLSCVQNVRKTLEAAAIQLTLSLQKRVYCIFLVSNERCPKIASDDKTPEILLDENNKIEPQEEQSRCTIQ